MQKSGKEGCRAKEEDGDDIVKQIVIMSGSSHGAALPIFLPHNLQSSCHSITVQSAASNSHSWRIDPSRGKMAAKQGGERRMRRQTRSTHIVSHLENYLGNS